MRSRGARCVSSCSLSGGRCRHSHLSANQKQRVANWRQREPYIRRPHEPLGIIPVLTRQEDFGETLEKRRLLNMTKTLQNSPQEESRSRKRILKPVVEKKRRDRINHSLAELRTLLLNSTSDPRLQNPKIEKAEILDLAVEYLHKWTSGANDAAKMPKLTPEVTPPHQLEPSSPLFTMENAGFKQCIAQLASYMHKVTPAQRTRLIEGLKNHAENVHHQPSSNPDLEQRLSPSSLDSSYSSEKKEDSLKFPFLSHSYTQSPHCSTPRHDYLSPPPSPWFSPLSGYSTSPPFMSYACHFTFPSTLSPPSSCTSLSTLPAPTSFTPSHTGHYLRLQPPPRGASSASQALWRPW